MGSLKKLIIGHHKKAVPGTELGVGGEVLCGKVQVNQSENVKGTGPFKVRSK